MATKYQSQLQVGVGDIVELVNSHYRATTFGVGRVIAISQTGSTVEVLESTSALYRIGSKVRFNLNTWTDMIILQERGKTIGTGITARPVGTNA